MTSLLDQVEAERRYNEFKSKDPFPKIYPALLNSADIEAYITATGMICPFDPNKLKSASYEICLEGKFYFWEKDDQPKIIDFDKDNEFILEENSIAFFWTKTKFRIPDYIALRFNLTITNVHRGILLGTGPLVDPGFEGHLLIPLHNLTTNKYKFTKGEGIIWIEFTKLSEIKDISKYKQFSPEKKNREPEFYFSEAAWGRSIRSSIPDAMQKSRDDALKAEESAEKAEQNSFEAKEQASKIAKNAEERAKEFGKSVDDKIAKLEDAARQTERKVRRTNIGGLIIGLIALVLSLYWGLVQIHQLVLVANNIISLSIKDYNKLKNEELKHVEALEERVHTLEKLFEEQGKSSMKEPKKSEKLSGSLNSADVRSSK